MEGHFFEGAEKKVELIVDPSRRSLRELGDAFWGELCQCAGARILSVIRNVACDAYLLSESSLFVYDHKMLMITCGRTRLLDAVRRLLREVGIEQILFFVYERKNEAFPHSQPTSFFDDARVLNETFPGRAYRFGDEDEHHLFLYNLDRPWRARDDDITVEVLMYGIDGSPFRDSRDTETIRRTSGLDRILPGFEIDDHHFEPHGYSLNGIRGERYWTAHVTPNPLGSYASFETNALEPVDIGGLVPRVLEVFEPRSFDVVLFDQREREPLKLAGHRLRTHVARKLECGYHVQFLNYYRPQAGQRRPEELPLGPPVTRSNE